MTEECLKTTNAVVVISRIMLKDNDKKVLLTEPVMVHKDITDDDLKSFMVAAVKLDVDKDWKDNSIVLMNDNCICMKGADNKFYLFNATISMMSATTDNNTVSVWCDYKTEINKNDFIELGA